MAAPPGSRSTDADPRQPVQDRDRLRRQQIIGILLIAAGILVFTLVRANWHELFPQGWWRW